MRDMCMSVLGGAGTVRTGPALPGPQLWKETNLLCRRLIEKSLLRSIHNQHIRPYNINLTWCPLCQSVRL